MSRWGLRHEGRHEGWGPPHLKVLTEGILNVLYSACFDYPSTPFDSLTRTGKVTPVLYPGDMTNFDSALIVWGGADISPDLYKHPTSARCAPYSPRRDRLEWDLMKEAVEMEIPIIAVCRGAQMACAAAGGFLLQDVNRHAGNGHSVKTSDGKKFWTNSLHHQMMVPYHTEHELVAWAEETVGAPYVFKDDKMFNPVEYGYSNAADAAETDKWREPEFVYFKKLFDKPAAAYAIQWHPEMMADDVPATRYILQYIKKKEEERAKQRFYVHQETKEG